jgi:hypothetical protein
MGKKGVRKIDTKRNGKWGEKAHFPPSALGRSKPEGPPPQPPSTWRVTLTGDAPPLEVMTTSFQISTHGVLLFKGGPDGISRRTVTVTQDVAIIPGAIGQLRAE